ncbi:recombination mediator RecR [Desulfuromonas acetoxidans]|uniref:Recombination protein RecR n=1 Tax=Desulfuromonas acetoxidans (strain DSM 684 / 11070) TaxID=281689 RepID=Q1K474_DESA6|nr:recombination mediator RecR [Desulfuromonas acetoxidans]EAT17229.1 recombination protein RecR [Desulfuromonas acetoxidans DSM 684]MBF0645877.1 recombination protein RecR [Desulfuromonas acetoxidans]NVD24181.1 recombination protein RecR [Desulfuromonas acetoxidans]NVE15046.1 recombination protein RecR [Desulfuromonas acetoxidans]
MLDSIPSLNRLIVELGKFPGIGRKTATRLAFHVMQQSEEQSQALVEAIQNLKQRVRFCSTCFHVTEQDPCVLCTSTSRDDSLLCVVEQPQDLMAIERGHSYRGRYHVLHGVLSPLDGVGPDDLKIAELVERVRQGNFNEVIVATNFSIEGEATALYLSRLLQPFGVRITRLAHGIPMGSDLEYVDDATVGRAIEGRRDL